MKITRQARSAYLLTVKDYSGKRAAPIALSRPVTTLVSRDSGQSHTFSTGELLDKTYQLQEPLGSGGMGVVFSCSHVVLQKSYAVKILSGDNLKGEHWSRFRLEAKVLARLKHPSIVAIHNMGIADGQWPYFVMDLLSGETMASLIEWRGRLPVALALDLFIQLADALNCAHQEGIIHRDIKPSNIMVVRDEDGKVSSVKLVDFGIARVARHNSAAQKQTATGAVFGTPLYMSPEQSEGRKVDERSDIYSLGCALFEALTGMVPFEGNNAFETFLLHQTEPAPTLTSRVDDENFPQSLERAVAKMLCKNADERYQSMLQIKHDLERIKAGKPIQAEGRKSLVLGDEENRSWTLLNVWGGVAGKPVVSEFTQLNPVSKTLIVLAAVSTLLCVICGGVSVLRLAGGANAEPLNASRDVIPAAMTQKVKLDTSLDSGFKSIGDGLSKNVVRGGILEKYGASKEEIDAARKFDFMDGDDQVTKFRERLQKYVTGRTAAGGYFLTGPEFVFPNDLIVGHIRIGKGAVQPAIGLIPVAADDDVCLYLGLRSDQIPGFMDMIGPADLTGLEIASREPDVVLRRIREWKRLRELCFFNSEIKALPSWEGYDECQLAAVDLSSVDKLTQLRSLGLAGPQISGAHVARLKILKSLDSLKLKRISKLQPLLAKLPSLSNIKELWFVAEDLIDSDLEMLTKMRNLQTLRIRRSFLTPQSLAYFKRMPALKHLVLDRDFSAAQKAALRRVIPDTQFETVTNEGSNWDLYPKSNTGEKDESELLPR